MCSTPAQMRLSMGTDTQNNAAQPLKTAQCAYTSHTKAQAMFCCRTLNAVVYSLLGLSVSVVLNSLSE
jgi:hypothetical protein